jgi:hypothetical protein
MGAAVGGFEPKTGGVEVLAPKLKMEPVVGCWVEESVLLPKLIVGPAPAPNVKGVVEDGASLPKLKDDGAE